MVDNSLASLLLRRKQEAEVGLFACLLADPTSVYESCSWLGVEGISDARLKRFWEVWLKNRGDLDKTIVEIDPRYQVVTAINEKTINQTNTTRPEVYAERIQKVGFLIEVSRTLQQSANLIGQEKMDEAITVLNAVIDNGFGFNDVLKTTSAIHDEFAEQLSRGWDGIETGFDKIDYTVGRLLRGHLSVIASRTSVGKTALAWHIACRVAADTKNPRKVLYFSTESSAVDLWIRRAAGRSGVNWRKIVSGGGEPEEIKRILQTSKELQGEYGPRLVIDDEHDTLVDIQRITAMHKPDLVIVDHLDEIQVDKSGTSRSNIETSKVVLLAESVRVLRRIAKRFNAHVICVHQLNRDAEKRGENSNANPEPKLSDLRWSGDIEQKADIVFLLHRPDLSDDSDKSKLTEVPMRVKIAKNRLGARDVTATIMYNLVRQDFYEKRDLP